MNKVIAIDGPSGSGKSTMARLLGQKLGFLHVDSGALYRIMTWQALARGVKVTGATVHFVDNGMDTGPILMQKAVNVEPGDTSKQLQQRVMEEAEWKILPAAIDLIANGRVKVEDGKAMII